MGDFARRWLRDGAIAITAATLSATGVAIVGAHGGDANKIHTCVITIPAGNNQPIKVLRLVEPGQTC